jgi:transposase
MPNTQETLVCSSKLKLQTKNQIFYAGVDPHKKEHVLAAITPFGDKLASFSFENSVPGFKKAEKRLLKVAKEYDLKPLLGVEDTGGNGSFFTEYMHRRNFSVKTVSPVLVDHRRRKNTHPEKSDSRDAEEVARVLLTKSDRLPDFILSKSSSFAKDLNLLVRDRECLINEQTRLKNKLHAALQDTWGIIYKEIIQRDIFGKRAIGFFLKYPAGRDFKKSSSKKYIKPDFFQKLKTEELPEASEIQCKHIRRHFRRILEIKEDLADIEKEITEIMETHYPYLLTLNGCGIVNASKILAEVNDINRFANNSKLARYSGIAPVKCESGETKNEVQSKYGNARLREAIKSISLTQISKANGSQLGKAYYRKKLKQGKTKKQALRCLMRQILKIMYKMIKQERAYY